jgi:precorrin-6Y C5,15-methyltransferase (decarboxylating)
MGRIFIIGVGPGSEELLTPAAVKAIEESEVLVGGKEVLKKFNGREKKAVGSDLGGVMDYIRGNRSKRIGVLTSGDPCFYSLLGRILKKFPREEVEIIPGISSLQLCFARIKETMNDATLVSLHGRSLDELLTVMGSKKLVVLTDNKSPANAVAEYLLKFGAGNRSAYVGENLGRKMERITDGNLKDIAKRKFSENAVMVVINEGTERWEYLTPGIPEELFDRGNAPMTKAEVRAVTLSKLRLREDCVVYDIGAGTGSISIEAGLRARKGTVYAVEKDDGRVELIRKNISKFGLVNVRVVNGEAPEALMDLPVADRIIIGGSGGRLAEVLRRCDEKLVKEGLMVMNFIALESLNDALSVMEKLGYEYGVTQLIVNKSERLGGKLAIIPKTSVFVVSARKKTK